MRTLDFKKFRTPEHMSFAMLIQLEGKQTRSNRVTAVCPRPACKAFGKRLLCWDPKWPVAYCHGCHQVIDALDIVRIDTGKDYYRSSEILESSTVGN